MDRNRIDTTIERSLIVQSKELKHDHTHKCCADDSEGRDNDDIGSSHSKIFNASHVNT